MGADYGRLARDAGLALFFASALFFTTAIPLGLRSYGTLGQALFLLGFIANMLALGYIAVKMPRKFSAAVVALYLLFFGLSVLSKYVPSAILHFMLLTFPLVWLLYISRVRPREIAKELRLHKKHLVLFIALGAAVTILVVYPVSIIEGLLLRLVGVQDVGKVGDVMREAPIWLTFFSFLVAPFSEEIFFRAFIYLRLRKFGEKFVPKKAAMAIAILVSTVLFSAAHYSYGSVVEIVGAFTVGLIFCGLFILTDSLASVIAAHALFNFISVCVIYLANYLGQGAPVGLLH